MSLRIRLRHALAETIYDLPTRRADQPIIVGRGVEAELQTPSVHLAPRHAALFVHDGRWVVQDLSGGATSLNGRPLAGPSYLDVGDVVTLGDEPTPPTLEVQASDIAETPPPATPVETYAESPAAEPLADLAWAQPGPATGRSYARRRRSNSGSQFGPSLGGLLVAAVIGGGAYYYYQKHIAKPLASNPSPTTAPVVIPSSPPMKTAPSVFDFGRSTTAPSVATAVAQPTLPDPTDELVRPPTTEPAMAAATRAAAAPADEDPEWQSVEQAYHQRDPALAILRFDAYGQSHRGQHVEALSAFTDDMLDRLWWQRIDQLLDKRTLQRKKLEKAKADIEQETDETHRTQKLIPERDQIEAAVQRIHTEIKEMSYGSDAPPPLFDEEELEKFRRKRDPAYYAQWKARVLNNIRRTHGQPPWANEK